MLTSAFPRYRGSAAPRAARGLGHVPTIRAPAGEFPGWATGAGPAEAAGTDDDLRQVRDVTDGTDVPGNNGRLSYDAGPGGRAPAAMGGANPRPPLTGPLLPGRPGPPGRQRALHLARYGRRPRPAGLGVAAGR